ncbi:DnaD domain protein [Macrococcoides caseolyticum]|uniref:DnaD domain protein n=1 Tax=Macrococcoides caseolyticum TaxID=69966 RepID=UPI000C332764|nr:DnaD domain protein [Macrococcus caseolyticus]PKE47683.1 hypothetical protein CW677_06695 [Macrococcus caseolyticus]PKF14643.1 hypothetical protein CW690_06695 [Macrococcus caseolyticus]
MSDKSKGYVLFYRDIMDHAIFSDPYLYKLFSYCIFKASHRDREILFDNNIVNIEKGQFIWGRKVSTNELNLNTPPKYRLSESSWERKLKTLEKLSIINRQTNNKYTLINVVNYENYQHSSSQSEQINEQQMNNRRTTDEQQMNTNNTLYTLNTLDKLSSVEPNPKNDFAEVIGLYQSDIQATPPLTVINKLSDDFDMFGKDIMLYAIKKSALAGNRDYRFIDYLTRDWRKQQLKTLEAVEQYEDKRNQPKQSYSYNNDRNAVPNKFGDRPDLSFQALEIKKGKGGLASFTEEEYKAYESYYL